MEGSALIRFLVLLGLGRLGHEKLKEWATLYAMPKAFIVDLFLAGSKAGSIPLLASEASTRE
jgi:hypothetical protein